MSGGDFLALTVQEWLDALAAESPAPGGGSAAAMTAATAAAVVAMTARATADWPEAAGIAAQAAKLRARLTELAQTDADVYSASLEALAAERGAPDDRKDFALGTAVERAADPPLAIAETACDVALLATAAAARANPQLQADAQVAASLAAAAAAAAARLVDVNLTTRPGDERVRRARAAAERAAEAARESVPTDSLQSAR